MKIKTQRAKFVGAALALFLVGVAGVLAHIASAQVAELRVFSSDGMQPAVRALTPKMEHSIGRRVNPTYDSSNNLVDKINAGEAFDVAILTTSAFDAMIKQGKIAPDSRIELARCGVGVGIRKGAHRPDISTPEAMKRALLSAKVVTYNSTGATASLVSKVFESLGIVDAMKSKISTDSTPGGPQKMVAAGKADLVMTLVPEVTQEPGVEYLGPLPGNLQSYINFAGGISPKSHDPGKAKALLQYIAAPAAAPVLKAKGLEQHK